MTLTCISCECLAEWCYICGEVWKTCHCDAEPPNENQLRFDDEQGGVEDNDEQSGIEDDDEQSGIEDNRERDSDADTEDVILAPDNVEREVLGLSQDEEGMARALAMIGEDEGFRGWGRVRVNEGIMGDKNTSEDEDASEDEDSNED